MDPTATVLLGSSRRTAKSEIHDLCTETWLLGLYFWV